ncbi:IclR family transcriptional regulator [Micrococcus luteus]|nr:IclR family transcriptional regulator [Micrococcus luteus]
MSTRAVVNALKTVEVLAVEGPIGLSELARRMDLSKATLLRVLRTFEEEGWAEQMPAPDQRWRLASKVGRMVSHHGADTSVRDAALDVMSTLQRATTETVHLSVPAGGELVLVERVDSAHELRPFFPLGTHFTLHGSASGVAFLARQDDAFIDRLLEQPLHRVTEATPTRPEEVWGKIRATREAGYSRNVRGSFSDISSVGAAITDGSGAVVATLSVSGASSRMTEGRMAECGPLVADAARQVSARVA